MHSHGSNTSPSYIRSRWDFGSSYALFAKRQVHGLRRSVLLIGVLPTKAKGHATPQVIAQMYRWVLGRAMSHNNFCLRTGEPREGVAIRTHLRRRGRVQVTCLLEYRKRPRGSHYTWKGDAVGQTYTFLKMNRLIRPHPVLLITQYLQNLVSIAYPLGVLRQT